ncbi:MAG: hypothetical protein R3F13_09195 [Prosthecobacter sp.]
MPLLSMPLQAESEPNNAAQQAEVAEVGKPVSFTLTPLHDRDYFKVKAPGEGTLRFKLTRPLKQHNGVFVWWGEDGKGGEVRTKMWDRRVTAGEVCTFAVRSNEHSFNEVSNDEIIEGMFEFVPEHAASEPNDVAQQAEAAEVGKPVSFALTPLHDRDYFKVKAPGKGTLRFKLTRPLKQHKGVFVWWGEDGEGGEIRAKIWDRRVTAGEVCTFAVRSSQYSFNEVSNDEIIEGMFEFVGEALPGEPNDTPELAQTVELEKSFGVIFLPLHDRDYFKFTPSKDGIVTLRRLDDSRDVHPGLHPTWVGEDGKIQIEGSWDHRVKGGRPSVLGLRSSNYSFNETAADVEVPLILEYMPEPAAPESGDSIADAREVDVGEPFLMALIPSYDQDFYKVRSPYEGRLKLRFISEPPGLVRRAWRRSSEEEGFEADTISVAADETVYLGVKAWGWSSERVLQAVIEYADGVKEGTPQTRKWTFKLKRQTADAP